MIRRPARPHAVSRPGLRRPRRRRTLVVGALALTALAACLPDPSKIEARLEAAVQPKPAPETGCVEACGITLKVVSVRPGASDQLRYEKSFGTYKGTETPPIASATKWISGATIMSLVDDGLLSLTDRVSTYFPSTAGTQVGSITVAQLFSHTSGMDWRDAPCMTDRSTTLAACASQIVARPLVAAPGTTFAYGGNSMQVAGRIAEIAGGDDWISLVADRVLTPLGMTRTRWIGADNVRVDGGLVSGLADYDRFVAMIQRKGLHGSVRVLSAAAVDAMEVDRAAGLTRTYTPRETSAGYGIGAWIEGAGASRVVSSPGAFGVTPLVDRGRCYRMVLWQNSRYHNARSQMETIKPELDRQLSC